MVFDGKTELFFSLSKRLRSQVTLSSFLSFSCLLTTTDHTSEPSTSESCELKILARKDSQGNQLTSSVILSWIKVWKSPFFYIFLRIEPNIFLCI